MMKSSLVLRPTLRRLMYVGSMRGDRVLQVEESSLKQRLYDRLNVKVGPLLRTHTEKRFSLLEFSGDEGRDVCVFVGNAKEETPLDPMEVFGEVVGLDMPRILVGDDGQAWTTWETSRSERHVMVMEGISGKPWNEVKPQNQDLLSSLGRAAGSLCTASMEQSIHERKGLEKFGKLGMEEGAGDNGEIDLLPDEGMPGFKNTADASQNGTRWCIGFGIAGAFRVRCGGSGAVEGVNHLFGMKCVNAVHSVSMLVAEALIGRPDLLSAASWVVEGFHESCPLIEEDLSGLYIAIEYHLKANIGSQANGEGGTVHDHVLKALHGWSKVPSALALFVFRHACRLEPCPTLPLFLSWVNTNHAHFSSILDFDCNNEPSIVFDFSVSGIHSKYLHTMDDMVASIGHVAADLNSSRSEYGIGRYLEPRLVYSSDAYKANGNDRPISRTIHLGMDLFVPAQTLVRNPVPGIIHSFRDNDMPKDYGPTIIVEHKVTDDLTFFSLFGHLSKESLQGKSVGSPIGAGEILGWVGASEVNGGWAPHVHYQIILDLCSCNGDFVGAAYPHQKNIYASLCPDPNTVLRIAPSRLQLAEMPLDGPRSKGQSCDWPDHIVRGFMQYLYDGDGIQFLSMYSREHCFGFDHPRLGQVANSLSKQEFGVSDPLIESVNECSMQPASRFPEPLGTCFFLESREEATRLALKLAQLTTGKHDGPVLEMNGTGCTILNAEQVVSPQSVQHQQHDLHHYDLGTEVDDCEVLQMLDDLMLSEPQPCGFWSQGDVFDAAPELAQAFSLRLKELGQPWIVDEEQTGFGRLGSHFWEFEKLGIIPDIVVVSMSIDSNNSCGAVVTTDAIAKTVMSSEGSYSIKHDCRCAHTIMECMKFAEEQGFQNRAQELGSKLLSGLYRLQETHSMIGRVEGCGLLIVFSMLKGSTLEPSKENAFYVVGRLEDNGILVKHGGKHGNSIMIAPPLIISTANVEFFVDTLDSIMKEDAIQP